MKKELSGHLDLGNPRYYFIWRDGESHNALYFIKCSIKFYTIQIFFYFNLISPQINLPQSNLLCYRILNNIGEGNGNPLQYSCLENPMDGGAWWAAVHGVAKSRTRLSDFTFTFHFHALEKEMATHSSVLAWRIPGMGEPGGLPSMGSHRVGHD